MICIDKSSKTPLYLQIYTCIKSDILSGRYTAHSRLPATRQLAKDLGISRNTVDLSYQQLVLEGYITPHPCSGFEVEPIDPVAADNPRLPKEKASPSLPPAKPMLYDFWYPLLDPSFFPLKTWKKLYSSVLNDIAAQKYAAYPARRGEPQLQEAIAAYLFRSRGVHCQAEQVIISCGVQMNLELLLKLFDPAKCSAAIEEPGYTGAKDLLLANHFRVIPLKTDHDGLQTDLLTGCSAGLLYLTPSHQFPTGAVLPANRRMAALDWAEKNHAYLIEDDYDSELRYFSNSVPSLQSFDRSGCVIYMGTFSKVLSPGLRISYLVLPQQLLQRYLSVCGFYLCQVPLANQLTLARFINSGGLERHIRRLRHCCAEKQAAFLKTVRRIFGDKIQISGKDAGLHLLVNVKTTLPSEELVSRAKALGVGVYATKPFWSDPSAASEHQLILGYGGVHQEDFEPALRLLFRAWFAS